MIETDKIFRAIICDLNSLNEENFFYKIDGIHSKIAELADFRKKTQVKTGGIPEVNPSDSTKFAKVIREKLDTITREKKGQIEIIEKELLSLGNHKKINLYNQK